VSNIWCDGWKIFKVKTKHGHVAKLTGGVAKDDSRRDGWEYETITASINGQDAGRQEDWRSEVCRCGGLPWLCQVRSSRAASRTTGGRCSNTHVNRLREKGTGCFDATGVRIFWLPLLLQYWQGEPHQYLTVKLKYHPPLAQTSPGNRSPANSYPWRHCRD
jgi:hypothetical protein